MNGAQSQRAFTACLKRARSTGKQINLAGSVRCVKIHILLYHLWLYAETHLAASTKMPTEVYYDLDG